MTNNGNVFGINTKKTSHGLKNRLKNIKNNKPSWYTRWWGVFILIILGLILILISAFGFYVYSLVQKINSGELQNTITTQQFQKFAEPGIHKLNKKTSAWQGAIKPKLTIVEFIDFNCPVCQTTSQTIKEIYTKHGDEVKIIARHFPVIAESSLDLALASECAHEQNKFWQMHDALFASTNPAENLQLIAMQAGLNLNKFNTCLEEEKYLNNIKLDANDANSAGARGTPTFFINGHKVDGGISRDMFLQLVETLIDY